MTDNSEHELLMPTINVEGIKSSDVHEAIEKNGYFAIHNPEVMDFNGNYIEVQGEFRIRKLGD